MMPQVFPEEEEADSEGTAETRSQMDIFYTLLSSLLGQSRTNKQTNKSICSNIYS